MDTDVRMLVAGELVGSETSFEVVNPASGNVVGRAPQCTQTQLDTAFDAAAAAFPAWAALSQDERAAALRAAADRVAGARDELAPILAAELGKPVRDALVEIDVLPSSLRAFADKVLPEELVEDSARARIRVVRRPLGVVAILTPWNAAISLFGQKAAPALSTGNTVVLKPSPITPLATLRVGELLAEVLPPGVLNVVSGEEPLGSWMTSHPVPRKVSFTGSIPVGKLIARAAGDDLKRLTLELGGNDAAIILPDADLDARADTIFMTAFGNCGQGCAAIKRVYAVGDIYDDVVKALAARADSTVVGDPQDPNTQIGPCATEAQRAHVEALIADAANSGARIAAGGKRIDGPGYFHELTIVADAKDGMRVVDEEQFGPVLPVIRCESVEEAIEKANATMFALGASVWSTDMETARQVSSKLEAGTVWINAHRSFPAYDQPFGGWKWSGLGLEKGRWGLEAMTQVQTLFEVS